MWACWLPRPHPGQGPSHVMLLPPFQSLRDWSAMAILTWHRWMRDGQVVCHSRPTVHGIQDMDLRACCGVSSPKVDGKGTNQLPTVAGPPLYLAPLIPKSPIGTGGLFLCCPGKGRDGKLVWCGMACLVEVESSLLPPGAMPGTTVGNAG